MMNANNKLISRYIKYCLLLIGTITLSQNIYSMSKDELKESIDKAAANLFFTGKISELPNKNEQINNWISALKKAGDFIKASKSTELPPIFDKYFNPIYLERKSPRKNGENSIDLSNEFISKIKDADNRVIKSASGVDKLKEIILKTDQLLDNATVEIKNVTTVRPATADAKDLLSYIVVTFKKILEKNKNDLRKGKITIVNSTDTDFNIRVRFYGIKGFFSNDLYSIQKDGKILEPGRNIEFFYLPKNEYIELEGISKRMYPLDIEIFPKDMKGKLINDFGRFTNGISSLKTNDENQKVRISEFFVENINLVFPNFLNIKKDKDGIIQIDKYEMIENEKKAFFQNNKLKDKKYNTAYPFIYSELNKKIIYNPSF